MKFLRKNGIVEKLNHLLYAPKKSAIKALRVLYFIASFGALAVLVYILGFTPNPQQEALAMQGLNVFFALFIFSFVARWFFSFGRLAFLRQRIFRLILCILLIFHFIFHSVFGTELLQQGLQGLSVTSMTDIYNLYQILIWVYLFLFTVYNFIEVTKGISLSNMEPATVFVLSFILLIFLGTGLLMLPAMSVREGNMPFLDALFTSTSAACVTGLIVVDTATYFTFKGHMILLLLIQFGGLGIISFASYFASSLTKSMGIRHQSMLQEFLSGEDLLSTLGLLKQIIKFTFVIEGLGAVLIYFNWGIVPFGSTWQKVFYSIFHSVSAFCNAGFSLYSNNFYEPLVRESYSLHLVIVGIVILGGIGFASIRDIFSFDRIRQRLSHPWKQWQLGTRIAVYVSAVLLIVGTVLIYFLEEDYTLRNMRFGEALVASFFQSGIARTAGFNTIDISALRVPTLLIIIFLMFIGASSGSFGGGIKTSTFYVILSSVIATIRGRQKIEINRRYIPNELVFKAMTVFVFAAIFNLLAIFALTITQPDIDLIRLAFEQVSAFGTVGLSTGITSNLSDPSMIIIILSMFFGRVGTLSVALVLSRRVSVTSYKYPKAHLMIG